MIYRIVSTTTNWILRFIQLQLFISLISLPILINWGLPFSLLSPIGNLIFTPFIMIFLLLSSLIFFSELLCIPNSLYITCLELVYTIWNYIMSYIPFNPLIGFQKPHPLFLIFIPIATIALLIIPYFKPRHRSVIGFIVLFGISFLYLNYMQPSIQTYCSLGCSRGEVTIIYENNRIAIIDPGYIGQTKSASSWLAYTLMPHLTQTTGKTTIDHVILLSPTKTTLKALEGFIKEYKANNIYLPLLEDKHNQELDVLKKTCKKNGCSINEIPDKSQVINMGKASVTIKVETYYHRSSSLHYRPLSITYKNQNKDCEIFPIKHPSNFMKRKS